MRTLSAKRALSERRVATLAAKDPERRRLSARKAVTTRWHPDADVSALDSEMAEARAVEYVQKLVDSAPPLSSEQRMKLASLLLAPSVGETHGP